jgi:hypothetical protein
VTVEILDSSGNLVRRYSSADKPPVMQEELEQQLIPLYWLRPQRILSAEAGMHRWVWDLRYPPPNSAAHEYPIAAVPHDTPRYPLGPLVVPGKYQARLVAGGHTETQDFQVTMDPRVKASTRELQQQFEAEMKLASAVSESSEAVTQAETVHEQIDKLVSQASAQLKTSLQSLDLKVSELLDGKTQDGKKSPNLPDTNANVTALYGQVGQADAAPTVAQIDGSNKSEADLSKMLETWKQLKVQEIPAVNRDLAAAGLPQLRLDLAPQQQEGGEDED